MQYYPNTGDWYVYIWNFAIDNWQIGYEETNGYLNRMTLDGWDQFEAVNYDNTFAELNIVNWIESDNVMLDWGYSSTGISWQYAVPGSSYVCQLSSAYFVYNTNTQMSQIAYFDTQYSDWIVRDPIITVCAYDMYTWDPVYAGVYLNGQLCSGQHSSLSKFHRTIT